MSGSDVKAIDCDYWFFADDWDATYPKDMCDEIRERVRNEPASEVVEVARLAKMPSLYAVAVPVTFDDNGDPDETEVRLFASLEAAQAAPGNARSGPDGMGFIKQRTKVDEATGCWLWQLGTARGYGQVKYQGGHQRAHRLAWTFSHGPIPDGLHVLHSCDNKGCCNPGHLFLGTHRDNMNDLRTKRRANRLQTQNA